MTQITIRSIKDPSFRGIHNAIKAKAWLTLYDAYLSGKEGLTLSEMAEQIGHYNSLRALLPRWIRYRYIGYKVGTGKRQYHLLKRGRDWLDRWAEVMPLARYMQEIEGNG